MINDSPLLRCSFCFAGVLNKKISGCKKLPLRHGLDGRDGAAMEGCKRTGSDTRFNSSNALTELNLIAAGSFGQYANRFRREIGWPNYCAEQGYRFNETQALLSKRK